MVRSSALVLLHFQNDIVTEDGAIGRHGNGQRVAESGVLAHASDLLHEARLREVPVVHVGAQVRPDDERVNHASPQQSRALEHGLFRPGSEGSMFHEDVAPLPDEKQVLRPGIGLFAGTDLDEYFDHRRVVHLVLCGVSTRVVVEAAVFDATDRGMAVTVVSDACTAASPAEHDEALLVISRFAQVTTTSDVVSEWSTSQQRPAPFPDSLPTPH